MEPKKIDWTAKRFEANGKTYHIATTISIGRSVYAETAKIELETGMKVGKTHQLLAEVYELLNKGKVADAAVKIYNHTKAIEGMTERPEPVLRICACYLNTEGEDITDINDTMVQAKIDDWRKEGLSRSSFFQFALSLISAETGDLRSFTAGISEVIAKDPEKLMKAAPIPESLTVGTPISG